MSKIDMSFDSGGSNIISFDKLTRIANDTLNSSTTYTFQNNYDKVLAIISYVCATNAGPKESTFSTNVIDHTILHENQSTIESSRFGGGSVTVELENVKVDDYVTFSWTNGRTVLDVYALNLE